jgi:hypothetical protein
MPVSGPGDCSAASFLFHFLLCFRADVAVPVFRLRVLPSVNVARLASPNPRALAAARMAALMFSTAFKSPACARRCAESYRSLNSSATDLRFMFSIGIWTRSGSGCLQTANTKSQRWPSEDYCAALVSKCTAQRHSPFSFT